MGLEMWQGLKPNFFLGAFCGTTEVMPCYKARFDGVFRQLLRIPGHESSSAIAQTLRTSSAG
jgi:hypothetical protein